MSGVGGWVIVCQMPVGCLRCRVQRIALYNEFQVKYNDYHYILLDKRYTILYYMVSQGEFGKIFYD